MLCFVNQGLYKYHRTYPSISLDPVSKTEKEKSYGKSFERIYEMALYLTFIVHVAWTTTSIPQSVISLPDHIKSFKKRKYIVIF